MRGPEKPAKPAGRFRAADRLVLRTMRRSPLWFTVVVIAEVAGAGASLLLPDVLARVIDEVLAGGAPFPALAPLGGVLAAETAALVLGLVAEARITSSSTAWLRKELIGRVLALGIAGRRRFGAGELTSRLIGDVTYVTSTGPALTAALAAAALAVGGLVGLLLIDWRLAAAIGFGLPVVWLVLRLVVRDFSAQFEHYIALLARIADRLATALGGVRTIRAAGAVERDVQRVLAPLPDLSDAGHAMWRIQRRTAVQLGTLTPLVWVVVLIIAGFGVAAGRLSPGEFIAAAGYAAIAFGLFDDVEGLLALAQARAGAARVCEVLDEVPPVPGACGLPPGRGELLLRGVTVVEGEEVRLDRVELWVPPGAAVALVGDARSGVATLAMVAAGLTTPDRGVALLDGVPMPAVAPQVLRRAVACAFARPRLLGVTVADAIGFASPGAPGWVLERAARTAHADVFIRRLPRGYDTPLDQAPLSGGEAQRLGLARAIAANARLTVFDDATASLDMATEMLVSTAITRQLAGRTRIVVTHRAATAARADLVAWLQDGRVRAIGPHGHLWADPAYRAVFAHTDAARCSS
jgi:ATP-binding cassette, subfamily B, bacterial RamA/AmfB